jgi:hypothetical protein
MTLKFWYIHWVVSLALLACAAVPATAQHQIQGVIITKDQSSPILKAVIAIDSVSGTRIRTIQSDSLGKFTASGLYNGRYIINVSHTAYRNLQVPLIVGADSFLILMLTPNVLSGELATVVKTKPVFERRVDRFVFTPGNSPMVLGNNVWDILSQTPTVQANEMNGLSVLGNPQGATVYINRQRLSLGGEDLIQFLKSMPAGNIIRIEVLTIPPPSYDTEGPVIDIYLRRYNGNGLKGSITSAWERASVGKTNISLNLDYNNNAYNQSGFINYSNGKSFQEIDKTTLFTGPGSTTVISDLSLKGRRTGWNGYTDIRYAVNPKISVGTQWLVNQSDGLTLGTGREKVMPANLLSTFRQDLFRDNLTLSGNMFMKYFSEKKGQYLELSGDYLKVNTEQTGEFIANISSADIRTVVPQTIENLAGKIDYSKKKGRVAFESGFKWSQSDVTTPYEAFNRPFSNWIKIENLSANFRYKEQLTAIYASLEKQFSNRLSGKFGFRLENTTVKTRTKNAILNTQNTSSFLLFFPIGYLTYVPRQGHFFSLTSRTSNNRPEYFTLNPARLLLGIRTVTEGNPFLTPSGGGVVEFMYGYKERHYFGLNYTVNRRLFSQVNEVLAPDTIVVKWQNWGNQQQYSAWYYFYKEFFKRKWAATFSAVYSYNARQVSDKIQNVTSNLNNNQFYLNFNNSFSNIISPLLKMYLNTTFSLPQRFGLWTQENTFRLDFGASWSFKNGGWRLGLAINDIFKYNDRRAYMENITGNQQTRALTNNDSRSIRLTVTKPFGKTSAKSFDKRETSNEEEKQRAN